MERGWVCWIEVACSAQVVNQIRWQITPGPHSDVAIIRPTTGPRQNFRTALQKQPMLRVHCHGFAVRQAKVAGIKQVDAVDQRGPTAIGVVREQCRWHAGRP